MSKKKKLSRRGGDQDSDSASKQKPVSFTPFKDLKKLLADRDARARKEPAPLKPVAVAKPNNSSAAKPARPSDLEPIDEASILREAYAGVTPLGKVSATRLPVLKDVRRAIVSEEAEVLAALSDLVSGLGHFDLTETDEYVEGMRVGLDPRLISRLRRGEFAMQDHIDLHGMIQPDAKLALQEFILKSVRKGMRTVLVVHGRGLGSPGGRPVLKHAAAQWLSHGEIGAHVHAFTSARHQDGGAGAMYVLLRRDRRRAAFDILQGAKRRD
jgi:DNA-nicking Smr family endonuclease